MADVVKITNLIHELDELKNILNNLTDNSNKMIAWLSFIKNDSSDVNFLSLVTILIHG